MFSLSLRPSVFRLGHLQENPHTCFFATCVVYHRNIVFASQKGKASAFREGFCSSDSVLDGSRIGSAAIPDIDHAALDRSCDNSHAFCRRVDHPSASYVNAAVSVSYAHITRLWIAYSRPSHKCSRIAKSHILSCQTVAHETGTVKCSRAACPQTYAAPRQLCALATTAFPDPTL